MLQFYVKNDDRKVEAWQTWHANYAHSNKNSASIVETVANGEPINENIMSNIESFWIDFLECVEMTTGENCSRLDIK